jgi:hypothetical protein
VGAEGNDLAGGRYPSNTVASANASQMNATQLPRRADASNGQRMLGAR